MFTTKTMPKNAIIQRFMMNFQVISSNRFLLLMNALSEEICFLSVKFQDVVRGKYLLCHRTINSPTCYCLKSHNRLWYLYCPGEISYTLFFCPGALLNENQGKDLPYAWTKFWNILLLVFHFHVSFPTACPKRDCYKSFLISL